MAETIDPQLDTPQLAGQVAAMHRTLQILVSALRATSTDHERAIKDLFAIAERDEYPGLPNEEARESYRSFLRALSKGLENR